MAGGARGTFGDGFAEKLPGIPNILDGGGKEGMGTGTGGSSSSGAVGGGRRGGGGEGMGGGGVGAGGGGGGGTTKGGRVVVGSLRVPADAPHRARFVQDGGPVLLAATGRRM